MTLPSESTCYKIMRVILFDPTMLMATDLNDPEIDSSQLEREWYYDLVTDYFDYCH